MTFSIVAWDPIAREWGVAVASRFLGAGAVVPWAKAGCGAIATQAYANVTYGPVGLELLATMDAGEVVAELTDDDPEREERQLGIVDRNGNSASFTGSRCSDWAGSYEGEGFACQGNILTGEAVVPDMVAAFESAAGDLAGRLLAAVLAGDRAGGDRRGKQSAAMLIAREDGGYLGETDIAVDLRVDDHTEPVEELARLLDIHRILFPNPDTLEFLDIDDDLAGRMAAALSRKGFATKSTTFDEDLQRALFAWVGNENLEMRWTHDPRVERIVLDMLLAETGSAQT